MQKLPSPEKAPLPEKSVVVRLIWFAAFEVSVCLGFTERSIQVGVRVRFCLQRAALLSLKCGFEFVRSVRTVSV